MYVGDTSRLGVQFVNGCMMQDWNRLEPSKPGLGIADLAMIGGLPTLLRLLESAQPGIRSRAAEVLATSSQANPPVQARPIPCSHLAGPAAAPDAWQLCPVLPDARRPGAARCATGSAA